jgi:hypothetical protein
MFGAASTYTSEHKPQAHADARQFPALTSFRYCFKAPDQVNVELNEIQSYLSGRLLSCSEATFRILGLKLHQEWPSVERLDLHLPLCHNVVFNPLDDDDDIRDQLPTSTTKLLQWFILNQREPTARRWRYIDIPEHFVWSQSDRTWRPRVRDRIKVARLPSVSGYNLELQALRMILHVARGAESWVDLLTVYGHVYSSFRDAAQAAGLLEDDGEAISIFHEMTRVGVSVNTLREQFCSVLVNCAPSNPVELFNMFAGDLIYGDVTEESCLEALCDIDRILRVTYGKSLRDAEFGFNVEIPANDDASLMPPIANIDPNYALLEILRPQLSVEQQSAVASVMESVLHQEGFNVFGAFCSAGTGKTLFANFLACSLRAEGRSVACVAASALAASLLEGGHTAHHVLHIPIPANDGSFCSFTLAERSIIMRTDLIIWDEASMISNTIADTVDRTFCDIMDDARPFGGKTVVFIGDFKQLLPVVRGGRGENHTLHRCDWWSRLRRLAFHHNWRASQNALFASMLEEVGSGTMNSVIIPSESRAYDLDELIQRVYGNVLINADVNAMVLTLTLDDADVINDHCIEAMGGCDREVHASDTYLNCNHPDMYPREIISGIRMPGAPPNVLKLKLGARYMIIKNLMKTVFNGVRCQLVAFAGSRCVFVKLISGPGSGTTMLLPSCVFTINSEQSGLPFNIRRRQLPLIVAYAVTVHKAQGQTLAKVGLYVTTDMFTHGQLYTALSRTRGWSNIVVFTTLPDSTTLNNFVCPHVVRG